MVENLFVILKNHLYIFLFKKKKNLIGDTFKTPLREHFHIISALNLKNVLEEVKCLAKFMKHIFKNVKDQLDQLYEKTFHK